MKNLEEYLKIFESTFLKLFQSNQSNVNFSNFKLLDTEVEELVDFELERENGLLTIKYNGDNLIKKYISNKNYSETDLNHLFEYFSYHEFGHTLIPKYVRDEFMIQCYKDIENLSFLRFLQAFREFYAESFASQNCLNTPEKYLKIIVSELTLGDPSVIYKPSLRISKFILNHLYTANKCYVFKRWEILSPFFLENNLLEFQKLLHSICLNFEKIIEKFSDYYIMRDKLKIYVEILDKYDLSSILKNETQVDSNLNDIDYD